MTCHCLYLNSPGLHRLCVRGPAPWLRWCLGMEDVKTGMESLWPQSTQNTESCHVYADASGSRWHHVGTPEVRKVPFWNWFGCCWVPVCRLSTQVPRAIPERPMRKWVNFLPHVPSHTRNSWLVSNQAAILFGFDLLYAPFPRNVTIATGETLYIEWNSYF